MQLPPEKLQWTAEHWDNIRLVYTDFIPVYDQDKCLVALVARNHDGFEQNINLLTRAPDLYKVLKQIGEIISEHQQVPLYKIVQLINDRLLSVTRKDNSDAEENR